MDPLDDELCCAWRLFLEDPSDEVVDAFDKLVPVLVDAGYVIESGHSPTGYLWAFTEKGVEKAKALGCR